MKDEMRRHRENIEILIDRQEQIVEELKGQVPPEQLAELTRATRGKMKIPEELLVYGNGRIPDGVLALIGIGRHRLWGPAAEAFRRMYVDGLLDGVMIGVTDSYRSYEAQVDVARRKGLYKNGGLAATPGTSNHGWGLALDLDLDYDAQTWMRENAGQYGFVEDTPRESWHWGYYGHMQ
ncbi:MAG: M15 family metallopeptidase [Acidimicrobiia bacterium]|nr:M15 family metallopeptidase [Acidimicrobiia bacterium]